MSPFGVVVLGVMGAIWGVLAVLGAGAPPSAAAVPAIVGLLIAAAAIRLGRRVPPRTPEEEKRVGRLIGLWSTIEGIAIGVGNVVLTNIGRSDEFVPLIAIIVGLHFVPLARGLPLARYYLAAVLLVGAGGVGWMIEPVDAKWLLAGSISALTLWSLALATLRRLGALSRLTDGRARA